MTIDAHVSQYLSSKMYVVKEGKHAIIVDPFICGDGFLDGLNIDLVLLTHEHFDHISGVTEYQEKYGSVVLCSEKCAKRLDNPRKNMSAFFDVFTSIPEFDSYQSGSKHVEPYACKADRILKDDESFEWMGHEIKMISTPGHTSGSACYMIDGKHLFSGDTLFASCETTTGFPSGSKAEFAISARKLLEMEGSVQVYPGHFECFTLGERFEYLSKQLEVV